MFAFGVKKSCDITPKDPWRHPRGRTGVVLSIETEVGRCAPPASEKYVTSPTKIVTSHPKTRDITPGGAPGLFFL